MDIHVGSVVSFEDPGRKVLAIGDTEVGVFRLGGQFAAYLNVCPHLGGPVCQGKILPLTLEAVDPETKASEGREFSKQHTNIICPWHGYEFDIRTGRHVTNSRVRLPAVAIRVEAGEVYVTLPNGADGPIPAA